MDTEDILSRITELCHRQSKNSRLLKITKDKIANGTANYADAQAVAIEQGEFLQGAFEKYIPDALTDGRLYRDAANVVLRQPIIDGASVVADVSQQIQNALNDQAEIGIRAITPDLNEDWLDGIVTGICNADSYDAREKKLYAEVINFLEGYVSDFVQANAEFHYASGLEPTIERRTDGKCCKWCSGLAGVYKYRDVRNRGNDVYRRHNNCHCQVLYNPGDGSRRRQNVHTKRWTEEDEKNRIDYIQRKKNLDQRERGFEEARVFGKTWQKASLQDVISRFAPGSAAVSDDVGRKIAYTGDRYRVIYDPGGNYFRIVDMQNSTKRRFVDDNGNILLNIMEDGKERGLTDEEYQALTHFLNTDKER